MNASTNLSTDRDPFTQIVLFLGSNTDQKGTEYGAVAWSQRGRKKKGFRFHVRMLGKYKPHPSSIEDGSYIKNAGQKDLDTKEILQEIGKKGSPLHLQAKKQLRNEGLHLSLPYTYGIVEDSVQALPVDIWFYFKQNLAKKIRELNSTLDQTPSPLLENVVYENIDGIDCATLNDFGPIIKAIGITFYFNALRKAALKAGYASERVPLFDVVTCFVRSLADPEDKEARKITATNKLYLFAPNGLDKRIEPPNGHHLTAHFLCTEASPNRPIASNWNDYIVTQSFRRIMFDKIAELIATELEEHKNHADFRANGTTTTAAGKKARQKKKSLVHGYVLAGRNITNPKPHVNTPPDNTSPFKPPTFEEFFTSLNMEFAYIDNKIPYVRAADTVTLMPFNHNNKQERLIHYTLLASAHVAVQTDPRYRHSGHRPIVMNLNGCFDAYLAASQAFTNSGLSNNHPCPPAYKKRFSTQAIVTVPGISHRALAYCDVLDGKDWKAMQKARLQLIEYGNMRHAPLDKREPIKKDWINPENTPKPPGLFTIGILVSADNEYAQLGKDVSYTARLAGKLGCGLVYGAMEKNPGGRIHEAYRMAGGSWFGGCSTHNIVQLETYNARLADHKFDAAAVFNNISDRVKWLLLSSDFIVGNRGGEGTAQEVGAFLAGKELYPAQFENKTYCIFDTTLSGANIQAWAQHPKGAMLLAFLGKANCQKLIKDHYALAHMGILLATDRNELKSIAKEAKRAFTIKRLREQQQERQFEKALRNQPSGHTVATNYTLQ